MKGSRDYCMPRVAGASDDDSYSDDSDFYDYSETKPSRYSECVLKASSVSQQSSSVQKDPPPPVIVHRYSTEAVRLACIRGDLDTLKEQISKDFTGGIDDAVGESGENPLLLACLGGNLPVIKYLLEEKHANPDWVHPLSKVTGLIAVSLSKREEDVLVQCATALIDVGANLNAQDEGGRSALMIASKRKMSTLANFFLLKGANPNLMDPEGHTALFFAAGTGSGRMCRLLLENGADIFVVDCNGWMVADFTQHKRLTRLASALYAVQSSNWKPGMDSSLMEELGSIAEEIQPMGVCHSEGKLLVLLSGVGGQKFLDSFKEHEVTFSQLLTFSDDHLRDKGVNEIGTRMEINDIIKMVHTTEWQLSSIRRLEENKKLSAAEIYCMLFNISLHFERIASTLTYIRLQIEKYPIDINTAKDKQRVEDVRERCLKLQKASFLLKKRVRKLCKLIVRNFESNRALQITGVIEQGKLNEFGEKEPSFGSYRRGWLCGSIGLVSMFVLKLGFDWSKGIWSM